MKRFPTNFALLLLLSCAAFVALASSGGGFTLAPYTIDGGGGAAAGAGYTLRGSIAQAEVGTQVGGVYGVSGGFWAGLPKDTPTPTETPVPGDHLLVNGGFEDYTPKFAPKTWPRKFVTADKVQCNTATKRFSHTGACAYKFVGSPAEKSIIQQDVVLSNFSFAPFDTLQFRAMADVRTRTPRGSRVRIIVRYGDGTPQTALNLPLTRTEGYQPLAANLTLLSGDVTLIRVVVEYKARAGATFLDGFSLFRPRTGGMLAGPPQTPPTFRDGGALGTQTPERIIIPDGAPDLRGG